MQITDLHLQDISGFVRRVARQINALRPDVLVITGDSIDQPDRLDVLAGFLALLTPDCAKYATLGNWEHWARVNIDELSATYGTAGCQLLVNSTVALEHRGHTMLITGLDDSTAGHPDLNSALAGTEPRAAHVVLAHSPVYRDVLHQEIASPADITAPARAKHSFTCVLSGHTHGGQVALFGWAPIRPVGSGPYVSGWYRERTPPLYVSRGIGTSIAPVRLGAPPEIAVFDLSLGAS